MLKNNVKEKSITQIYTFIQLVNLKRLIITVQFFTLEFEHFVCITFMVDDI